MDRRGFLQSLMIGAAALAVDPEQLLWTPGKKTIFIPRYVGVDLASGRDHSVIWIQDRWIRRSDGIHVETLNFETDEILESQLWPLDHMPFVTIPDMMVPKDVLFGPYPVEDLGIRLTALMFDPGRTSPRVSFKRG
jgi:hypothetical protein